MKRIFTLFLFISFLPLFPVAGEIIITVDTVIENKCRGGNEAGIHISVTGGTAPYTFQWNGPVGWSGTTEDITGLIEGEYILTVTDQLDSTAAWDTLLTDPNPNATFTDYSRYGQYEIKCHGDSSGFIEVIFATGNGPDTLFTYAWEGPEGYTSAERNIDSLVAGDYFLTVADTLGCMDTMTISLEQPEALVYEIVGLKDVECYGPAQGYLKLEVEGGQGDYTCQWTGAVTAGADSIGGLVPGKYYFEITDSVGCIVSDSLTLSESDIVVISIDSIRQNPCLGQQVGAVYTTSNGGVAPYRYSWTGPNAYTSQLEDIENLREGFYSLELEDARGCIYSADTVLVDDDPISLTYSLSHFGDYNTLCHGDSTGSIHVDTVMGNGLDWKNFTYIWTGPGGYKAYEYQINGVPSGNYHLNVFDSLNCRSDLTITLADPPPLLIRYDSVVNNPCLDNDDGGIYISISGGDSPYAYRWTGPGDFSSNEQDITDLPKGRYSVLVVDSNACSAAGDTTLILVDEISLTIEVSSFGDFNTLCNGSHDAYIKIKSVTGYGDADNYYFYTTGPDGFSSPFRFMTRLGAGDYHITVTDSSGCMGEDDITLTEPPGIQTGAIAGSETFIEDTNYVYIVQDSSAGSTYSWTLQGGYIWGASGQDSTGIEVEWYFENGRLTVLETDLNGCEGDTVSFETERHTVVDTSSTSVPAVSSSDIRIYPVPAGRTLSIEGLENIDGSVALYSLTGTLVLKEKLQGQLDMGTLDAGIYYLLIRERGGAMLVTRRIIKR